jgi:plasmid stability protein
MASLTLRNIDESLKARLRMSAAEHGRSMEEEARQIIKHYLLRRKSAEGIGSLISNRFAAVGGVEMPEIQRHTPRGMQETDLDETK